MFDALCHLDFAPFDPDREDVLARGRTAGVKGWMVAGVRPSDWDKQASLLVHPDVFVAYGIHPHVAAHWSRAELDDGMEQLQTRRGLAVGEIGLDSSKYVPRESLETQLQAFRRQLAWARDIDLPVILHILGPHGLALKTLKQDGLPRAGGMLHSYSGSAELVNEYERLGLYISFSGSITRPNARRPRSAAAAVSPHRLLVETDCPDQRPSGRPAGRNLPEYLIDVVSTVAEVRGEPAAVVADRCAFNAQTLYGL